MNNYIPRFFDHQLASSNSEEKVTSSNILGERTTTLLEFLKFSGIDFKVLNHPPCRSSEESAAARASQGEADAIGAKALVIKKEANDEFALIVMPGVKKLDNKAARGVIGSFRFAKPDELFTVTGGLIPGSVPPFAWPYLPGVQKIYFDESICGYKKIGFNAATLDKSVVMRSSDYVELIKGYIKLDC